MLSPAAAVFWADFVAATHVEGEPQCAFKFGDSVEMADALVALVLSGRKTASAGLLRWFDDADPLPIAGRYSIVLDGADAPRCIIRTRHVEIKPLSQADDAFAWAEGEGDRSLRWWMGAHLACFERAARRGGFAMHPDIETVFERFELVWPRP